MFDMVSYMLGKEAGGSGEGAIWGGDNKSMGITSIRSITGTAVTVSNSGTPDNYCVSAV